MTTRQAVQHTGEIHLGVEAVQLGGRQTPPGSDTARAATSDEVKALRQEARALKEVVAEQTLELRLVKKNDRGWGRTVLRRHGSPDAETVADRDRKNQRQVSKPTTMA